MKKHQNAIGREKEAIRAANKEQRRRRKRLQYTRYQLGRLSTVYPRAYGNYEEIM